MKFSKYHGLGNDFVIVDLRAGDPHDIQDPDMVRALCDRSFGVGADGVLALLPAQTSGAHARMRVLNADGSEAEMCGNGLRCVVKYLYDRDPELRLPVLTIDTGAGPLACSVQAGQTAQTVTVDMGRPRLLRGEIPMTGPAQERCVNVPLLVAGRQLELTGVSMGNPHAIAFVSETGDELRRLAEDVGPSVETHTWFPNKTNAEFAHIASAGTDNTDSTDSAVEIELVVWERGVGITLACGTGACGTVVAACLNGLCPTDTDVRVRLLGGDLTIRVPADYSTVLMTGSATMVFDAEFDPAQLLHSAR